jgi:antitoxin MazE
MRVRIQRWGNSLALRIPRSFAIETALDAGTEIDLTLEDGRLVMTPLAAPSYSLEALLADVTPENLHGEHDLGGSLGAEAW